MDNTYVSKDNGLTWTKRVGNSLTRSVYGGKFVDVGTSLSLITKRNQRTDGSSISPDVITIGAEGSTTVIGDSLVVRNNGVSLAGIVNVLDVTGSVGVTGKTTLSGGLSVTGNINLGSEASVTIDNTLKVANISGYTTDTTLRIGSTLTTGSIQMGNSQTTGTITLGSSASKINIPGTIKTDIIEGNATTGTQSLFGTKTAGTLNIALNMTSGNTAFGAFASTQTNAMGGIYRFGQTTGGTYVSGSEPAIETGKHLTMMTGVYTKIVWYYNWSMWGENGGSMYFYYGGSPETATSATAAARISGAGAFITLSDINKKQDIQNLTYGLDTIQQLRPVSFSYKTSPNDTELGFIAQEVEAIIPEIVDIDGKEGDDIVKGLKYIGFIPILVKAVQEMKLDYDTKFQEIKADYDAKISNLEARLLALETKV